MLINAGSADGPVDDADGNLVVLNQMAGEFHPPIPDLQLLGIVTAMDRLTPQVHASGVARHAAKGANPFAVEGRFASPQSVATALD